MYVCDPLRAVYSTLFSSFAYLSFSSNLQYTSHLTNSIGHVASRLCLSAQYGRLCCLYRGGEPEGPVDQIHVIVNCLHGVISYSIRYAGYGRAGHDRVGQDRIGQGRTG